MPPLKFPHSHFLNPPVQNQVLVRLNDPGRYFHCLLTQFQITWTKDEPIMPIAHIFWPKSFYQAQASISCYFIGEHNCALAYPAALAWSVWRHPYPLSVEWPWDGISWWILDLGYKLFWKYICLRKSLVKNVISDFKMNIGFFLPKKLRPPIHLSRKRQCQIVFAKNWKDDHY